MRIEINIPDDLVELLRGFIRRDPSDSGGGNGGERAGIDPPPITRHSPPQSHPSPATSQGPPRNGRQFAGWIFKQSKTIKDRARSLIRDNGMSTKWTELSDDDAKWLHHELTARGPEPSRNGWGGGH